MAPGTNLPTSVPRLELDSPASGRGSGSRHTVPATAPLNRTSAGRTNTFQALLKTPQARPGRRPPVPRHFPVLAGVSNK